MNILKKLISSLSARASNDRPDANIARRRHPRREDDRCVIVICGQAFPVENWSQGGILLNGDERLFSVHQDVDFTIKFKLREKILDVIHTARVVRKNPSKIALEFKPLGQNVVRSFQMVIDDAIARDFANSQAT